MDNCTTCEHSVFDEKWGEYKCKKYSHRVHILLDADECPGYKRDPEKVLKHKEK